MGQISLAWEPALIGYIGSSYFAGFVLGCLTVPRLVARVGHIRVFTVLIALATALLVLGVVPIGLTSSSAPKPIPAMRFSFSRIFAVSQVAMIGAFLGGVVTGGFWALGPVVANANQLSAGQVGIFMAATILRGAQFYSFLSDACLIASIDAM